ncbi:MAG: Minf_1886 family protein [Gemmataceae bacterium]
MSFFDPNLASVVKRDPRFPYEAYEFLFHALQHTQRVLGRDPALAVEAKNHVSGPQLLDGIRSLALAEFGLMARTVFRLWGIRRTDDFGDMVFNLIEANLMSKTDQDNRDDFHDVFDLDEALDYRITLDEVR